VKGRLLLQSGLAVLLVLSGTFSNSGCRKAEPERRIEIWISPQDKPEILVQADKEYWSRGSGISTFNASIGPTLLHHHTVLDGELTWLDKSASQASFSFTLTNEKPVTVVILGVSPASDVIAEKDARRVLFYPPGKHSFKELLFVKYSYD
jgi:hypothetical protein